MADKNERLFDMEELGVDNKDNESPLAAPVLIEKQKSERAEKIKAERLEALRYAETYRQRLRLDREAKKGAKLFFENDEDKKAERQEALKQRSDEERVRAKEHSDRVRELLLKIEEKEEAEEWQDSGSAPEESAEEFFENNESVKSGSIDGPLDYEPLRRNTEEALVDADEIDECDDGMAEPCEPQDELDNIVKVDMEVKSDLLHIDGMDLGQIVLGSAVIADTVENVDTGSSFLKRGVAYPDPSYDFDESELIIPKHKQEVKKDSSLDALEYERELTTEDAKPLSARSYDNDDTEDLYINGEFDVTSSYPEPEREYISRTGKLKPAEYDRALDISKLDGEKRKPAYPDPEAPVPIPMPLEIDDGLMEPLPDVAKPKASPSRRERRENARAIKALEREDMLRFERESRENARFATTDEGDIQSVIEDTPGAIYPDPDYATDDPVVYGKGTGEVSKQIERAALERYNDFYGDKEKPKSEKEAEPHVFDKRALKRKAKESRALDILAIEEGYESKLRELRLELQDTQLRFDKKKNRDLRGEKEIEKEIRRTERAMNKAVRRAEADNERYFAPVLTDYTVAKVKGGADRKVLLEKREALLEELLHRDEINERLISLYTGREDGKRAHFEGRVMAQMKAKRRAYRRQRGLDRAIVKYHITHSFSKRLYALMDEYVVLSGDIARLEYSLKHEKLLRSVKRDMKKELGKQRRKLRRVSDHIDFYERRAIEEASDRISSKRKMIVGWSVLIGLLVLGVLVWAFWEPLVAYIAEIMQGGV